jgi:hypothetical protein
VKLKSKIAIIVIFALIPLFFATGWILFDATSEPPDRQTEIIVPYIEYEWWLIRWSTNSTECYIFTNHEGLPYGDDVYVHCGASLYQEWLDTPACAAAKEGGDPSACSGLYLHLIASEPKEDIVHIDLPLPEAWISFSGCTPVPPENHCDSIPNLLISAQEPLPNEQITNIQGTYNDIPFVCVGDTCEIPLRPTPDKGVEVTFWADSSFGDSSKHFSALVRVTDGGVSETPGGAGWFVDLMSSQYQGNPIYGCGPIWGSFPPLGGSPSWLSSPDWPELLASDKPYQYLAGKLIRQKLVDASSCPRGGLEDNGYATTCGLEAARPQVDEWQNRFDAAIVEAAQKTGIPAQLVKNLFAQESQFWPGALIGADEYGFGHLTEMGADTILLWNPVFYNQFCPLVLSDETCQSGYAQLSEEDQATLRGAVTLQAGADCNNCDAGINLSQATFSIDLFAETIIANCQQVGQIITNATGKTPGAVSSYDDLWRFTLVNYHAGPGCLSDAIYRTSGIPITWGSVAYELDRECPGVTEYVTKIAR